MQAYVNGVPLRKVTNLVEEIILDEMAKERTCGLSRIRAVSFGRPNLGPLVPNI